MLNTVGAVMILAACASIALSVIAAMGRHVRALDALISALEQVKGEITCRLTPMPELMERLSRIAPDGTRQVFAACREKLPQLGDKTMAELWSEAVYEHAPRELTEDETALLASVGLCLGRFDAEEQAETLDRAIERLRRCHRHAEEEKAKRSRVCAGLSMTLGLMLVILLL